MNTDVNDMTLKEKSYFYQKLRDYQIDSNNYILVHIDGRSFSKMIKNKFEKPFSNDFINMMNKTAIYLCENIQGVKLAYIQSDEITLLLKKSTPESEIFFNGRLCKMQSIIASLATSKFNQLMIQYKLKKYETRNIINGDIDENLTIEDIIKYVDEQSLYQFDCKVWDVPTSNEAMSWFLFRNIDCVRNSKQQTAQTYLPHKVLMGKNTDEQILLLFDKEGIDWNKFDDGVKYGRLIIKENIEYSREENGKTISFIRSKWIIKNGMDLTNFDNRVILKNMCNVLDDFKIE